MPVISRSALESSSLADLHEIASELGLDGYRRLRKADLALAIVDRQGGDGDGAPADAGDDASADGGSPAVDDDLAAEKPARRSRRGGRGRTRDRDPRDDGERGSAPVDPVARSSRARRSRDENTFSAADADAEDRSSRSRRSRGDTNGDGAGAGERVGNGTVELMPNGSGFLRVSPPEPSDEDVYISAAQVRRCELVAGDDVGGPVRPPRRSERYPSLIRIDTINGRSADEVAAGTRYDDLPCAYASERLSLDGEQDPTLKAIEWLTPIGRGSRAVIVGAQGAGKTEALRRIAVSLSRQGELECSVVLAGVRPEELGDWRAASLQPVAELGVGSAPDALAQAIERAVDTGRRVAARGGHAVVLVDTLEHVAEPVARRALGAARAIVDGGSLTVIATAREPLGAETTVIALDAELARAGRLPALDLVASATVRPELLVGQKGAEAIAEARAAALAA